MKNKNVFAVIIGSVLIIGLALFLAVGSSFIKKICIKTDTNLNKLAVSAEQSDTSSYGRILENCRLYKTQNFEDQSFENILFDLPKTYFVTILEETESFKKVRYNSYIGFVETGKIEKVGFIPQNPYIAGVKIKVKPENGTVLKFAPVGDSENITYLNPNEENIDYIASVESIAPSDGTSKIWYYVCISKGPTTVNFGYIYSERVKILHTISENTEVDPNAVVDTDATPIVPDTNIPTDTTINDTQNIETNSDNIVSDINPTAKTVLIILLVLPTILIFVLLYLQSKKKISVKSTE